jgi:hypothetical protein
MEWSAEYPPDFDGIAWEVEAKGWYGGLVLWLAGHPHSVTFYDPVRLLQNCQLELQLGRACFCEPGIVVVSSVTRERMDAALAELARGGFRDLLSMRD